MGILRLFTAIRPPSPAIAAVADAQTQMRQRITHDCLRWVQRDNLHLTLQFLGDVDSERVETVEECIYTATEALVTGKPVALAIRGVGAFPSVARPRVVWMGVEDLSGQLASVDRALRQRLKSTNISFDEKPFRPHVTISYVRRRATSGDRRQIAEAIQGFDCEAIEFQATHLCLVQSTLSPSGARYTDLYSAALTPERSATSSEDSARA